MKNATTKGMEEAEPFRNSASSTPCAVAR